MGHLVIVNVHDACVLEGCNPFLILALLIRIFLKQHFIESLP